MDKVKRNLLYAFVGVGLSLTAYFGFNQKPSFEAVVVEEGFNSNGSYSLLTRTVKTPHFCDIEVEGNKKQLSELEKRIGEDSRIVIRYDRKDERVVNDPNCYLRVSYKDIRVK